MTKEREILARGFDHLSSIAIALRKIQESTKDEQEAIQKSIPLSMVFRAINDVLHPLYADAQSLFPEKDITEFLRGLNEAHKEAVEKKVFPECQCSSCKKTDGVIEKESDATPSRNTDQA